MPGPLEPLLGRLAVERGLLTRAQIDAALRLQEADSSHPPLGVVLVEARLLTHDQVDQLLGLQAAAAGGTAGGADPHAPDLAQAWRFGALAVHLHLVSADQLNRALREQARREEAGAPWTPLGELLVQQGALTPPAVQEVLRAQAGEATRPAAAPDRSSQASPTCATVRRPADSATATQPAGRGVPAPMDASQATVVPTSVEPSGPAAPTHSGCADRSAARRLGKYELVSELGRGGMGVVYKAWHAGLRSYFAVKVLLAGQDASTDDVQRFEREAQAAARLKHPGILAVHDIGEADGKTYFAMDYVEGASLDKVLRDPVRYGIAPGPGGGLNTAAALRMTQEIAETLSAAHEAGVVHRDLKPANVIRDARDGRLKVMDFGLAKLVDVAAAGASGATATGTLIGTPAYMSPEQAAGDVRRIDARSDVYQLGAVLYELLAGRPPYAGATVMAVVLKVQHEDPVPLRRIDPTIDREAATICLKAMAREPEKRYASARALAEDCARRLNDEPIRACPAGWWERPVRWARRHKALAAVGAGGIVALLGAGALGLYAWGVGRDKDRERQAREAAERGKEAFRTQVLDKLRKEAGLYLDATLRLRRKGLKAAELGDYLAPMKESVAEARAMIPDAPEPHYSMGRMYRALMDFKQARAQQDEALAKKPDYAPSLYERAVLLSMEHRARVLRLTEEWLSAEGERLTTGGALGKGGGGGEKMRPVPRREELAAQDPEARALNGAIAADLNALERVEGSGFEGPGTISAGAARRAGALACARGLRLAYLPGHVADRARALLNEAIAADPTLEEAYEGMAALESAAGRWGEAVAAYTAGLKVDQGYVPFWTGRGNARCELGYRLLGRGEDPGSAYADAIADYGRALELNPASAEAWMSRGQARSYWGGFRAARGEDPGPTYVEAVADYDKALELDPSSAPAWTCRGNLRTNWGAAKKRRGEDPGPLFSEAIADLGKALELNPSSALAWMCRGHARGNLGNSKQGRNEDPGPTYAEAVADFGKALELNPALAEAWMSRGDLRRNWGSFKVRRDDDPLPLFRDARADLDRAVTLNPASAEARWRRGILCLDMQQWADAVGDFEAAIRGDPSSESILRGYFAEARARLAAVPWLDALRRAGQALQSGDHATSARTYEEGFQAFAAIPAAERRWLLANPDSHAILVNSHYNLACMLSLLCAGQTGPGAAAQPIPPADAARLRDRAFDHLREAVRLGWSDAAHTAADTDLAPLHDDPRWTELFEKKSD